MRGAIRFALGAGLLASALLGQAKDPVLDAMKDELQRSMTLSLQQLDRPYYVQYVVDDLHTWNATATLGGLLGERADHARIPEVRLRVGDYKFDNTNWVGGGGGGARYALGSFPLDEDYSSLRRYLWLSTDSAYKGALQQIARKRSALRNVSVTDQLPDFLQAPKISFLVPEKTAKFDGAAWVQRVKRLSAQFAAYPTLRLSAVEYNVTDGVHRFVNSEGSEVRTNYGIGSVQIRASAQAKDGMIVRDAAVLYTHDVQSMFAEADLKKTVDTIAASVLKLAEAPVGENYSGPVLFEGVAAPQMLAQILGDNLHISRKPVPAPGQPAPSAATELEGRKGVRIMPDFFDVMDDPTLKTLNGHALFGNYDVDDQAVVAKPLKLVEKGVLRDFFRTRQPVRGYSDSNGRARLGGSFGADSPAPSNLIIEAREKSTLAELKAKLIDLCQQRGLPYGILIRKLDFPSTASIEEARKILSSAASGGASRAISIPLQIYRVYPDGKEELVRAMRFRSLNARSLKDILAAGDDQVFFNYLENGAPFAFLGGGGNIAEVSVVSPSILMDDIDLAKADDDLPKLPIVPSPRSAR